MTGTPHSRIHRSGRHGLALPVPAAARDALHLSVGTSATWTLSPDGRTATLSFHAEASP